MEAEERADSDTVRSVFVRIDAIPCAARAAFCITAAHMADQGSTGRFRAACTVIAARLPPLLCCLSTLPAPDVSTTRAGLLVVAGHERNYAELSILCSRPVPP